MALRIPKQIANSLKLDKDTAVELIEESGEIRLRRISSDESDLASLLSQITENNQHPPAETGEAQGREAW